MHRPYINPTAGGQASPINHLSNWLRLAHFLIFRRTHFPRFHPRQRSFARSGPSEIGFVWRVSFSAFGFVFSTGLRSPSDAVAPLNLTLKAHHSTLPFIWVRLAQKSPFAVTPQGVLRRWHTSPADWPCRKKRKRAKGRCSPAALGWGQRTTPGGGGATRLLLSSFVLSAHLHPDLTLHTCFHVRCVLYTQTTPSSSQIRGFRCLSDGLAQRR
jgi:hypothetical protein